MFTLIWYILDSVVICMVHWTQCGYIFYNFLVHFGDVMWCDVMSSVGPSASVSWCKFECVIASPDNVKVMTEQAPPPPLVGGVGQGERPVSCTSPVYIVVIVYVRLLSASAARHSSIQRQAQMKWVIKWELLFNREKPYKFCKLSYKFLTNLPMLVLLYVHVNQKIWAALKLCAGLL